MLEEVAETREVVGFARIHKHGRPMRMTRQAVTRWHDEVTRLAEHAAARAGVAPTGAAEAREEPALSGQEEAEELVGPTYDAELMSLFVLAEFQVGFGRILVSEIKVPNMLVNLV